MKVILQQDVKGQGKKGQMVEVSDGYARNFLLPRKLALEATSDNINTMKTKEKARLAQIEREKADAMEVSKRLGGCMVNITAKAGKDGRLFGSVTTKEISEALEKQFGISIEKNRMSTADNIKSFGVYEVRCKLGYEVTGTFKVTVSEEK